MHRAHRAGRLRWTGTEEYLASRGPSTLLDKKGLWSHGRKQQKQGKSKADQQKEEVSRILSIKINSTDKFNAQETSCGLIDRNRRLVTESINKLGAT